MDLLSAESAGNQQKHNVFALVLLTIDGKYTNLFNTLYEDDCIISLM